MRYPACEKLEIIRTVEISPLPVRRTLAQIGIPKSTFYAWLDRYAAGGFRRWRIESRSRNGSGTVFQTMSASGSLNSPSTSPSCRRARSQ